MNTVFKFLFVIAWVLGSINLIMLIFKIYCGLTYSELDQMFDKLKYGGTRVWNVVPNITIIIICTCWIIATYL